MRRLTTALAALALTATLAACGADPETPDAAPPTTAAATAEETASADPTPEETASEEPAPAADVDELQAAADKIGCTGYAQSTDPAPHVDRWGTCDLGGVRVQLYYIPDDANFDAFIDASSAFGVTEAWVARVGAVVAAPDDQTLVEQLRTTLAS